MPRIAVVAGATGLVGGLCLRRLSSEPAYSHAIALVRQPSDGIAAVQRVVDFTQLDSLQFEPGADVFCALGTTIGKAGSKKAFRRVDFEHVVALAKHSLQLGARQFLLVSSIGANAGSSNFYLKTKGETEQAIAALPFHAVHIFRPGVLIGDRTESRPVERIAIALAKALQFALVGGLRKYRGILAESVATAMVEAALREEPGVHIYDYDRMRARWPGPT